MTGESLRQLTGLVAADCDVRLVVLPCAGAGPNNYQPLADCVPEGWSVEGYCAPGRESRFGEPFASELADLADELVEDLRATSSRSSGVQPIIVGHCFGALLGWHAAARFPVDALVACSVEPPSADGALRESPADEPLDAYLRALLGDREAVLGPLLGEFVSAYASILEADAALLDRFTPPGTGVETDILVLCGGDDTLQAMPWSAQTSGRSTAATVPGGHFFVWENPESVVSAVEAHLAARFRKAGRR